VQTVSELTPKQEKFCQAYVETSNGAEAYRIAYNSKAKPAVQANEASKLLSNPDIAMRVESIREALRANHGITLQDLLKELEEARKAALSAETVQSSAAVNATMSKAKLLGFDKPENRKDDEKPIPLNVTFEVRQPVADVSVTNAKS
jgi:phage terminase small subunit